MVHEGLCKSVIDEEAKIIQHYTDHLKQTELFSPLGPTNLVHIFTKKEVQANSHEDSTNYHQMGEKRVKRVNEYVIAHI
jgi:hypothetical protein